MFLKAVHALGLKAEMARLAGSCRPSVTMNSTFLGVVEVAPFPDGVSVAARFAMMVGKLVLPPLAPTYGGIPVSAPFATLDGPPTSASAVAQPLAASPLAG